MRCLIVDDEPLAVQVLVNHLSRIPDIEVAATCSNAFEAYDILHRQRFDLVFLDIQMPGFTGVELVSSIENPPPVIFTTAYREYAVEGFELDAVDYLLKPVSLPRLLRAIEKVRRQTTGDSAATENRLTPCPQGATVNVRADREVAKVNVSDIGYIESLGDYVKIHLPQRVLITKQRVSQLERTLEPFGFIRIHRSFLVPEWRIESFSTDRIRLCGRELPIGRSYQKAVLCRLRYDDTL